MLWASFFLANVAIWMMFVSLPMLLVGNAFIGLLEGLVLVWLFKVRWRRAVVCMVIANYVSMLAGLTLFGFAWGEGIFHLIWRPTIVDYREWFVTALGLAFVLSILLEWPLCRLSFSKPRRSWGRSLFACGMLQVVSYLLCLAPILDWYEEIHINDTVEVVPVASIVDGDLPFWVYFIDTDDGDIYRMRLDGTDIEHVRKARFTSSSRLFLWKKAISIDASVPFDLYVGWGEDQPITLLEDDFASSESAFVDMWFVSEYFPGWNGYTFAADLRPMDERRLFVRVNWRSMEVAEIYASEDGMFDSLGHLIFAYNRHFQLRFKTTIGSWRCLNPTILPGDLVIFEFGGQICALDLKEKKLAFIRFGNGPVVVREESPDPDSDQPDDGAEQVHDAEQPEPAPGEDGDRADEPG